MLITVAFFPWRLTHVEHITLGVSPASLFLFPLQSHGFGNSKLARWIIVKREAARLKLIICVNILREIVIYVTIGKSDFQSSSGK